MSRILLRDLTPGTDYAIQLRTDTGSSVSEWSRRFLVDVNADIIPPDVPAWAASNEWVVNGDTFVATWQAIDPGLEQNLDFDHYELELVGNSITTVVRTTNLSYTLTFENNRIFFTTPASTVTARVRSVDLVGNASAWSTLKSATNAAPSPVNSITTTALYEAVDVKWDPGTLPDDFKSFMLQVSTTSSSAGFSTVYEGPNTQFTHSSTMFATNHWFRVYVRDKFNTLSTTVTSSAVQPKSTIGGDTTPPSGPTGVTATPGFDAARQRAYATVSWTASVSGDTTEYEVRYSPDNTNWEYRKVSSDFTATRIDNLTPGQSYYFSVRAMDAAANRSSFVNAGTFPITTTADTTAPSQPSAPTASVGAQKVQVVIPGTKQAGGAMEADVDYYEVFASTTTGFTTYDSTTMLGTIQNGPAIIETFNIPASGSGSSQNWFVKIRAVDRSGNISAASNQATAAVGLILNANIADATITNAKISDLAVDKLTAGTGLVASFTVKSTLTMGDASNNGIIQSFDYVAGTTGYKLEKNALEINSGTIRAAALLLQESGVNIATPTSADFEATPAYYANMAQTNATVTIDSASAKFGVQNLKLVRGASAATFIFYTDPSSTGYNIPVNAGEQLIVSYYARNQTAVSTNVQLGLKYDAGSNTTTTLIVPTVSSATWVRQSSVVTVPGSATKALLYIQSTSTASGATVEIDGIQIERKVTAATTPSAWKAPGYTSIDGAFIRTGSIQSTADAIGADGNIITGLKAWSINTTGQAQFGDVLIRGRMIMGVSGSEPVYDPTVGEDLTNVSMMKSYNYVSGTQGWIIKSNGNAEFLQLAANSIKSDSIEAVSADKLNPGTVTADLLIGSKLTSIDSESLFFSGWSRTGSIVTLTMTSDHSRKVGDQITVEFDTPDVTNDTHATGVNAVPVTAVTSTTISYSAPLAGSNGSNAADPGKVLVTGRSVVMDPDGVTLYTNDGTGIVVRLPTNPAEDAFFAGNVSANSLVVKDDFLLQGLENYVQAGSTLFLNASVTQPVAAPTVSQNWSSLATWMTDANTTYKTGLYYDSGVTDYYTLNAFFGTQVMKYDATTGIFAGNVAPANTTNATNPYGLCKIGTEYYILVWVWASETWEVWRYTDNTFATRNLTWTYNVRTNSNYNVTATEWKEGGALLAPTIGTDGTNIYIARCNKSGKIVVTQYTATGGSATVTATNVTDNQNLKSFNYGVFDYGDSTNRWVITTEGSNNKSSQNYVFTASSGLHRSTDTFQNSGNNKLIGTTWDGSKFVSLAKNNRHYQYTNIAKSGSNQWQFKNTWFNGSNSRTITPTSTSGSGLVTTITKTAHGFSIGDTIYISGTSTALDNAYYVIKSSSFTANSFQIDSGFSGSSGAVGSITNEWESPLSSPTALSVIRRAKVNLSSGTVPNSGGINDPDRSRFYVLNPSQSASNFYRQDNPLAVNTQTFSTEPLYTGATGTNQSFPEGTPATIKSNNGLLELSSSGFGLFGSGTDASRDAGNKPALRIGDPAGSHIRFGKTQILAMTSDTAVGTLNLNADPTGDGPVNIRGMVKVGIKNSGTVTANTDKTVSVTFSTAYPASADIPVITVQHANAGGLANPGVCSAVNITRSGFDIILRRSTGTAFDMAWQSISTTATGS